MTGPRLIVGHVLIGEHRAVALYRLRGRPYSWTRREAKLAELSRMARLHDACRADHSLLRVSRPVATRTLHEIGRTLTTPEGIHARWEQHLQAHRDRLDDAWTVDTFLAVSLAAEGPAGMGGRLLGASDRVRGALVGLTARAARRPIAQEEIERLRQAEAALADRLAHAVGAERLRPASAAEIQWLHLRTPTRGIGEPLLDRHWRAEDPLPGDAADSRRGSSAMALGDYLLDERPRALVIESERGTSHQAMLALGGLPETVEFPGADAEALHHPLASLELPVDVALHCGWIAPSEALREVRRRVVDAHNQLAEEAQSHIGASHGAEDAPERARELERSLRAGERRPLLRISASFALGAASEPELEERVRALTAAYEARDIVLRRPYGLQRRLFEEHLPLAGRRVGDYARTLTAERVAALMPAARDAVGSALGSYLGRITQAGGAPVLFDPTEASREGRPPSVLLWGTPGSGKTIAAQLIALHAALRGALVLDLDPKPDHGLDRLPDLRGRVASIELSPDPGNQGVLDPLRIAPDSEAEDLATTYLLQLLPPRLADEHATAVRRAVKGAVADGRRSCMEVVGRLRRSKSAPHRRAGEDLAVLSDSGLARLGFAEANAPALGAERPVTTVRAQGLQLPDPRTARSDYTEAERISAATLTLLAALAMRTVQREPGRPKVVLFDEAWFLLASATGRALISRLNRMGRAMGATLLLATQRVEDAGEIEELIGTRIVFGLETHAEARRALALLGLDDDPALIEAIRAQRSGECLMRDVDDRVAQLQVDVAPERVLRVLDTTPRLRQGEATVEAPVPGASAEGEEADLEAPVPGAAPQTQETEADAPGPGATPETARAALGTGDGEAAGARTEPLRLGSLGHPDGW